MDAEVQSVIQEIVDSGYTLEEIAEIVDKMRMKRLADEAVKRGIYDLLFDQKQ